jgi:hypothetical protein
MNYTKYADTIDAIKEMYLEIGRLQRENAALRTQCETLTNRVDVLSTYVNDSVRDELDLLFIEEDE